MCSQDCKGLCPHCGKNLNDGPCDCVEEEIEEEVEMCIRDRCKKEQEIINGKIEKNFLFNSPSYAAAFGLGMNTNGRTDWKTVEGITLKDLEEKELQE